MFQANKYPLHPSANHLGQALELFLGRGRDHHCRHIRKPILYDKFVNRNKPLTSNP